MMFRVGDSVVVPGRGDRVVGHIVDIIRGGSVDTIKYLVVIDGTDRAVWYPQSAIRIYTGPVKKTDRMEEIKLCAKKARERKVRVLGAAEEVRPSWPNTVPHPCNCKVMMEVPRFVCEENVIPGNIFTAEGVLVIFL